VKKTAENTENAEEKTLSGNFFFLSAFSAPSAVRFFFADEFASGYTGKNLPPMAYYRPYCQACNARIRRIERCIRVLTPR
jgi:hypothetical protein